MDKIEFGEVFERNNKLNENIERIGDRLGLSEKGIKLTLAYHCNRCDYLWFPKDFDTIVKDPTLRNILNLMPPKSCARCKSRQWSEPRKRNRKLKFPIPENITNDGMLTVPRIKAAGRNTKRRTAQVQYLLNLVKGQEQTPVITIQNKRKKKKVLT